MQERRLKKNISEIILMLKTGFDLPYDCRAWNNIAPFLKELSQIEYRGEYLLHIACKHKAFNLVKELVLIGADVNKPSRTFGTTPLQIAFKENDFKTAYLLYRYGANLFYINDPYKGGARYDIKFYAKTKKAKQLFSLLEELEKDNANAKVKSDIEKLCLE
jgi:ankyrin repeat protein